MQSVQELLDRAAGCRAQAATATNSHSKAALIALAEEFDLQVAERVAEAGGKPD
jgi:hypothetical protein